MILANTICGIFAHTMCEMEAVQIRGRTPGDLTHGAMKGDSIFLAVSVRLCEGRLPTIYLIMDLRSLCRD